MRMCGPKWTSEICRSENAISCCHISGFRTNIKSLMDSTVSAKVHRRPAASSRNILLGTHIFDEWRHHHSPVSKLRVDSAYAERFRFSSLAWLGALCTLALIGDGYSGAGKKIGR